MVRNIARYIIYMYTFPNGKRYIGQTKRSLFARQGKNWKRYKRCRLLWQAIQKYGVDSIKTDILFDGNITSEEATELEVFYIEKYKTNVNKYDNPSYGYNLTAGGEGCVDWKPSEERKQQLAEQMYKLGKSHIGSKASEETRKKISESHKGLRNGYKMPEETKRKIGLANSLANMSEEERKRRSQSKKKCVLAFNAQTNEKLIFKSHEETAQYFGVRSSAVSRWISENVNPANGFVFMNYSPTTTER